MKFKGATKTIKGITKLVDSVTNLTKSGFKMVSGISSKRAAPPGFRTPRFGRITFSATKAVRGASILQFLQYGYEKSNI